MLQIVAVLLVAASAAMANAETFQATVSTRTLVVGQDRLVAMIGGGATDPAKVFAIPFERFKALAATPGSGVTVEEATFVINGMKGRLDNVGPDKDLSLIFDFDKNVILFIKNKEKAYREWQVPPGGNLASPKGSLKPLDKSVKMNGFDTKAYEIKESGGAPNVWVSTQYPEFAKFYRRVREAMRSMRAEGEATKDLAADLAGAQGLPIRVQFLGPTGYRVDDVLSVQTKAIPLSTFAAPPGYTSSGQRPIEAPHPAATPSVAATSPAASPAGPTPTTAH